MTNNTEVRTALVIGGGIAGPVTALALAKAGIEATVYEAHPEAADGVGAMLSIAPNGLAALAVVGADEAVRKIGQPVPGVVMQDGTGRTLADFHGFPGLPETRAVHRADLYRALADQAAASGITVQHGKRLTGVIESEDGVTARFADGSTATADILVGADGIRSTVRALIDPDAPGPAYGGVLSFGGIVPAGDVEVEPGSMYFAFGRAFLGFWGLPDGRIVWFGSLPSESPLTSAEVRAVPNGDWLARLRELYAGHVPGEALISRTEPADLIAVGPMEYMPDVPTWHTDRIVLVGDAVHAPSSSSGQGASLAAESAVELARCLRDRPTAAEAFAAYEALRRPRVQAITGDAQAKNRAKAGKPDDPAPGGSDDRASAKSDDKAAGKPFFPTPEQMFAPVHKFQIDWTSRA